ncbi:MAG: helix-turn-helix transcriptional regulator [Gammaproteobacteria bacterium]
MKCNKEISFYNRLKLLRTEGSVTRQQLADAVGVHIQTIGYIERRQYNLSLELAFKLAAFFNLSLDAVFSPKPFDHLKNKQFKASNSVAE